MAGRRTNLVLLVLLAIAFVTGALAYAIGTGWNRWAVIAHGVAGVAMVVTAPWKSVVAKRGLQRRRGGRSASLVFTVLVVTALFFGFLHSTGVAVDLGALTAMQLHVGAALVAVPLALWHVFARRIRLHPSDLQRRQLLRVAGLGGLAALGYAGLEGGARALGLPGSDRRGTGSYERGSFDPESMPVTQWLNDSVPEITADDWRLRVTGSGAPREWSWAELDAFGDSLNAVLDCTGGWYARQDWSGARLDRLVGDADGRSIIVTSRTGYARRFPLSDAQRILVATRVGGDPLRPGHGLPARLVVPGRRGFWWVKWIDSIEMSDTPWWLQSPFPLT